MTWIMFLHFKSSQLLPECNMSHLWKDYGRITNTHLSVSWHLMSLLIINVTMTNQATQMSSAHHHLMPVKSSSAWQFLKEEPLCQHQCLPLRVWWSVHFIYLLSITGPFHWHVAVPVERFCRCAFEVKPPSRYWHGFGNRKGWWFNWFTFDCSCWKDRCSAGKPVWA